jgi:hypothetical protein
MNIRDCYKGRRAAAVVASVSMLLGTLLICDTYRTLSQTHDEAAHIACGMEWLTEHTYRREPLHPPLARVAVALGPFISGLRDQPQLPMTAAGNAVIEANGRYRSNLMLARLGVIPFFWLAGVVMWRFVSRRFGYWEAAVSIVVLAFCPLVLAHAGVATTDVPLMSTFLLAIERFDNFLYSSSVRSAALFGTASGIAILTKLTAIPFLIVCVGVVLAILCLQNRRTPMRVAFVLCSLAATVLVLWAGYRFSVGPVLVSDKLDGHALAVVDRLPQAIRHLLFSVRIPAPEFFAGVGMVISHNASGAPAYLLGENYTGGRLLFFPVAILVKTPIPVLLLSALGIGLLVRSARANRSALLVVTGIAGPLLVVMVGHINIGLRHVLVIYPFCSVAAGIASVWLWNVCPNVQVMLRSLFLLALGWEIVGTVNACPDFLAYFNEPAEPYADRILTDSDLDWGQDFLRLEGALSKRKEIAKLWIAYSGTVDIQKHVLPTHEDLSTAHEPQGWIAISISKLRADPRDYGWLDQYAPVERIGHSILLYHVCSKTASSGEQARQ